MLDLLPSLDPTFLAVALFAVLITGISKSGLGGGLGQLSLPLLAMFISPLDAVAIMLPILCTFDAVNVWIYRKHWHKRNIAIMVPGAVVGIAVGALTFKYVNDDMIRLLIGVLTIIFAVTYFWKRKPTDTQGRRATVTGAILGGLGGFTSFVAHAGGGPVKMFLLPQRLEMRTFVGTNVYYFFLVNQMKIWPYFWLGQFSPQNVGTSVMLLPAVPIGVWIGWKLLDVINPDIFYKICYGVLFFAGSKLIYDGLRGAGYI